MSDTPASGGRPAAVVHPRSLAGDVHVDPLTDDSRQLAEAAASYTATFIVAYLTLKLCLEPVATPGPLTFEVPDAVAVVAVLGSGVLAGVAGSGRLSPAWLRRITPAYLVVAAACISVVELWRPLAADTLVIGVSWNCLWIVVYPLIAPMPRRTVWPPLLAATTSPMVLALAVATGAREMPELSSMLLIVFPTYLAAGLSLVPTKRLLRIEDRRRMGSYHLIEQLGHGGMGQVWKARHTLLARPAAVKLVAPADIGIGWRTSSGSVMERFRREARATCLLRSPHTVELYDYGTTEDGSLYYAMELLEGMDMATLVKSYGPVLPERAVFLLRQVCVSLAEAHDVGLVHRDIKPANLFVCRMGLEVDFVKVLDFGMVKAEARFDAVDGDDGAHLTREGFAGGTPGFMAPEVIVGDRVDQRADLYCLGCVAYWLLAGRLVFERSAVAALMADHVSKSPVPVSEVAERVIPARLEALVTSLLAKGPEDRPRDAVEVIEALDACPLQRPWDQDRATAWWKLHVPLSAPLHSLPPMSSGEPPTEPYAR